MNSYSRLISLAMLVSAAALLASVLPVPLGYWVALAALLLGPGLGMPRILFPRNSLSLPETLLVLIITSLFVTTSLFALLNAIGVTLTAFVINVVLLGTTWLSTAGAFIRIRSAINTNDAVFRQPLATNWLQFCSGVILSAVVTGYVLFMWW